jgi:hypothetical protein
MTSRTFIIVIMMAIFVGMLLGSSACASLPTPTLAPTHLNRHTIPNRNRNAAPANRNPNPNRHCHCHRHANTRTHAHTHPHPRNHHASPMAKRITALA